LQILLVDDEPLIGELTVRYLRAHFPDIHLKHVFSCQRGLEEISQSDGCYDGVLLDQKMPGVSGLQCLRTIREMWPTLPVIVLTGFGSEELRRECMEAGADDFVSKERIHDLLPHVIESATDRRRRFAEISEETERRRGEVVPDLQRITQSVQDNTSELGAIRQQVVNLETSIRKFERIITDGNGKPSVLEQLATIRITLESMALAIKDRSEGIGRRMDLVETDLIRVEQKLDSKRESAIASRREDRRTDKMAKVALIVAVVSVLGSILTVYLAARLNVHP